MVRVAGFTSGRIALTLPLNTVPGSAAARASTGLPGRTSAASLSGSSALTQMVESPLMRKSGAPASEGLFHDARLLVLAALARDPDEQEHEQGKSRAHPIQLLGGPKPDCLSVAWPADPTT